MTDRTRSYVTVGTFSRVTGFAERTVRRWCERGWVIATRTPGGWFQIPCSEIDRVRRGEPLEASAA